MDFLTSLNKGKFWLWGVLLFVFACNNGTPTPERKKASNKQHSDSIIYTHEPGKLKVLVDNSLTSYFVYKGVPRGFEYEMLHWFAKEHNLKIEIHIVEDIDHILDTLIYNSYDIAAANLNITSYRKEIVDFTDPILRARQVLIQKLPENYHRMTLEQINSQLIRDPLDLNGDTVHIRMGSSFYNSLQNFMNETGIKIHLDTISGNVATDSLIEMVSKGTIKYTVADENRARTLKAYFTNIDINTPISLHRPIGWALHKNADKLLDTLNIWIDNNRGSLEYNVIKNRYFNPNAAIRNRIRRSFQPAMKGKISNYDPLIKLYAERIHWNWILLAAQIFKESNFDHDTKSWMGAIGLLQVLPSTAQLYNVQVSNLEDPSANLLAGTRYIQYLHKYWKKQLKNSDSLEIVKFTLASYNVGIGHIEDARRLAKKYKLKPNVWDDNVETMLRNKTYPKYYRDKVVKYGYCRGNEPADYVADILYYYGLYSEFVKYDKDNNKRSASQKPTSS